MHCVNYIKFLKHFVKQIKVLSNKTACRTDLIKINLLHFYKNAFYYFLSRD